MGVVGRATGGDCDVGLGGFGKREAGLIWLGFHERRAGTAKTAARLFVALAFGLSCSAQQNDAQPPEILAGKQALAAKQFTQAKTIFTAYLRAHPNKVEGELGLADAELGLREYETAELRYREVVAAVPTLWAAHKNLVIVEAALGRWEEFDRERALLQKAKQSEAEGIDPRLSDVIDVIRFHNQRWIVRDYFEPEGRTQARYNFERFSSDGKITEFVSLESADAAETLRQGGDVVVVGPTTSVAANTTFALNWYDGKSHGTIATYAGEPTYEVVRADFLRWVKR